MKKSPLAEVSYLFGELGVIDTLKLMAESIHDHIEAGFIPREAVERFAETEAKLRRCAEAIDKDASFPFARS